jgi:hypothetical protein
VVLVDDPKPADSSTQVQGSKFTGSRQPRGLCRRPTAGHCRPRGAGRGRRTWCAPALRSGSGDLECRLCRHYSPLHAAPHGPGHRSKKDKKNDEISKLILLADSTWSGVLSLVSSSKIKKFAKYQSPNVYGSVEILVFMSKIKNRTKTWDTNFDFCNEDRYKSIVSRRISISASIATLVEHTLFIQRFKVRTRSAVIYFLFVLFFLQSNVLLYYYETFYYLTCKYKQI